MIIDFAGAPARAKRARIEREIDRLIGLLDAIDGDLDLEPSLGWPEDGPDHLAENVTQDDREQEDEHGGDVQDEPHDAIDEGNDEPDLGWRNPGSGDELPADWQQPDDCFHSRAELSFDGRGNREAKRLLRGTSRAQPKKAQRRSVSGRNA